jgi:4-amino-4-deoxy-L-arabinose transferase-like glycosyltransferase
VRLFPALIGSITVLLIGVMVKDLGGNKWAQILACLAFILSPAFMRSNTLFQPVSFDQFCWFLSAFFIVRLIKYQEPKYWYDLGVVAGLGFLTKYSILFFYAAFFLAILLAPQRKWLKTPYPYFAVGLAIAIALPNLIWQYQHNLPVVKHFDELSRTQLLHVQAWGFLQSQLRFHHAALAVWLAGLLYLFFSTKLFEYRILGWIYVFIILILVLLKGKSYYSLGAYPMLMAAGGIAFENFLKTKPAFLKPIVAFLLIMFTLPLLPYGLPVLSIENMQRYGAWMKDQFHYTGPLRWEDGKIHPLPQDYADMHGWEEMAAKVGKLYHSLPPAEQKSCLVYGGGYAHASSINYYRKKYKLPQ